MVSNQTLTARYHQVKKITQAGAFPEIELRLRSKFSANQNEGYECLFGLNGYINILRWNHRNTSEPLEANFTILAEGGYSLANGETLKASIQGDTITIYQNSKQIFQKIICRLILVIIPID